jgi:hypothetical protein
MSPSKKILFQAPKLNLLHPTARAIALSRIQFILQGGPGRTQKLNISDLPMTETSDSLLFQGMSKKYSQMKNAPRRFQPEESHERIQREQ